MKPTLNLTLHQGLLATVLIAALAGCQRTPETRLQGYVEGEFVHVASALPGQLVKLQVERGTSVQAGQELFVLESIHEEAARNEARNRLEQARATLEDARKGLRPSEIESLQAQLKQGRETVALSGKELARQETLGRTDVVAVESVDRARSTHQINVQRVEQLEAELKTAQLGLRADAVAALEAEVRAREATLAKAEWELAQKRQSAPQAGLVDDTLYREGEWVAAGRPIVSLLPPTGMKVRAFVPQARLATLKRGDVARVRIDGLAEVLTGRVSFIAPQAEYTPPVIYSRENRSKLVFLIELRFDDATAARLHPGQPVDVELP